MGKTYLATTENREYEGMVARVRFTKGRAIVNEDVVVGGDRDLPETIRVFRDLGITITEVFRCEKCDEVFKSQKALSGHGKAHAKEKKEEEIEKEE